LNSVLISERIAEKYFSDENPLGKVLTLSTDFVVSGVFENMPENSHVIMDIIASLDIVNYDLTVIGINGGLIIPILS